MSRPDPNIGYVPVYRAHMSLSGSSKYKKMLEDLLGAHFYDYLIPEDNFLVTMLERYYVDREYTYGIICIKNRDNDVIFPHPWQGYGCMALSRQQVLPVDSMTVLFPGLITKVLQCHNHGSAPSTSRENVSFVQHSGPPEPSEPPLPEPPNLDPETCVCPYDESDGQLMIVADDDADSTTAMPDLDRGYICVTPENRPSASRPRPRRAICFYDSPTDTMFESNLAGPRTPIDSGNNDGADESMELARWVGTPTPPPTPSPEPDF